MSFLTHIEANQCNNRMTTELLKIVLCWPSLANLPHSLDTKISTFPAASPAPGRVHTTPCRPSARVAVHGGLIDPKSARQAPGSGGSRDGNLQAVNLPGPVEVVQR